MRKFFQSVSLVECTLVAGLALLALLLCSALADAGCGGSGRAGLLVNVRANHHERMSNFHARRADRHAARAENIQARRGAVYVVVQRQSCAPPQAPEAIAPPKK